MRFIVRSTQCTGASAFRSEQDADSANATDCATAPPSGSDPAFARAAELQVFRSKPDIND